MFYFSKEEQNKKIMTKEYMVKFLQSPMTKGIPQENILNPLSKWDNKIGNIVSQKLENNVQ